MYYLHKGVESGHKKNSPIGSAYTRYEGCGAEGSVFTQGEAHHASAKGKHVISGVRMHFFTRLHRQALTGSFTCIK